MHEDPTSAQHDLPFVQDDLQGDPPTKSLHFASWELQSRMRLDQPDALDVEYTRTMMGFLLFNSRPASIAMIGLGGGSLAKFCHRHLSESRIAVIEINPLVIALRDEFKVPRDSHRFQVIEGDGADYVAHAQQGVDVLLVDGFDGAGMPDRLATQAFYDHCQQALSPDGVMVVNLHVEHPQYEVFIARIERSFGANVLKVPVKREGNNIVFACNADLLEQQRRSAARQAQWLDKVAWADLKPIWAQVADALWRHHAGFPLGRNPACP
ncbi:MAG: fused MFS/spermidine synthase [Rhizobacter sp.]